MSLLASRLFVRGAWCNRILLKQSVTSKSYSTKKPVLTLFSKASGCSLCDEAKEALAPFKHRFEYEEVDISSPQNKEWFQKYCYDIPVIHINHEFLMKHRVDVKLLQSTLEHLEKNS